MAFSNSGGTLTLPSPTHMHQVDGGPSVRALRRSLSRSPSKFRLRRGDSHSSDSSTGAFPPSLPESPCPLPPPPATEMGLDYYRPSASTPGALAISPATPAPPLYQPTVATSLFATPLRSGNMKLSLRSARPKSTSSKPVARLRYSPKSPLKRALSVNTGMGNAAPSSSTPQSAGPTTTVSEPLLALAQENSTPVNGGKFGGFFSTFGSTPRPATDKPARHSMHLDLCGDARPDYLLAAAAPAASPLKRSDANMDSDQAIFGSPVAKRRSLHGIPNLGSDLSVFEFSTPSTTPPPRPSFEIHEDGDREYQLVSTTPTSPPPSAILAAPAPSTTPATVTKRTSSLRKSTLQQRHDPRSSWGRRQGEKYLAQQQLQQQQQQQQQQNPDDAAQPPKRPSNEWLFTAPHFRSRPRPSLDQFMKPDPRDSPFRSRGLLPNPSTHPFERPTALTSAATSSTTAPPPPHQPHPLSRTLTTSSSGSSLPDESPTHFPVQLPADRPRPAQSIFTRSLPLNAHRPRPDPVATPQYKAARPLQSVFASAGLVSKMNRHADDETLQRPGGRTMVMPDTPCKKQVYPSNTYPPSSGSGGRKQHQQRRFFFSAAPETPFNAAPAQRGASTNGTNENVVNFFKLRSSHARTSSLFSIDGDVSDSQGNGDSFDFPPTPTKSVLAKNLFGNSNRGQETSPIAIRDLNATASLTVRRSSIPFVSPNGSSDSENTSPKTPRESSILHNINFNSNMAPPDASRLSISNGPKEALPEASFSTRSIPLSYPPATPTTDREAFVGIADRRVSLTPVHAAAPSDVDAVLSSMFSKVECVGKGEFSQVFRVTARHSPGTGSLDYFNLPTAKQVSASSSCGPMQTQRVFAVKKVRLPFYGQKTRESKMKEVAVLEAVRNRENVLQIFDHWERNNHLYIQTEYCDEGALDGFLKKVGEHGRLDDFRIWKILLEMSQGVRYIHDAGFIHLDLKPANVLITYEGHLKIGDFGMAAEWPAPKGIEGEGDREYIGPEILQGKYDKPADVFSLGLIVLEIACNVFLPDNGPIWVALREGDMSVVSSLTAGEANALARDILGMPIIADSEGTGPDSFDLADSLDLATMNANPSPSRAGPNRSSAFGRLSRRPTIGAEHPPKFMADQHDAGSLDSVVAQLINPDPARRPTIHEVLEMESLQWVFARRRAPATVFEGNWGPEEDVAFSQNEGSTTAFASGTPPAQMDTEMTDV